MFASSDRDIFNGIQKDAVEEQKVLINKIDNLEKSKCEQKGEDLKNTENKIARLRAKAKLIVNHNYDSSNGFYMQCASRYFKYTLPLKALLESLELKKGASIVESTRDLIGNEVQLKFSINNFLSNRAIEGQDAIDYLKTFPYCEESQEEGTLSYTGYKIITFSADYLTSTIKDLAEQPNLSDEQKNARGPVRSSKKSQI